MAKPEHIWRFFTAGGFDQVKLESAGDLCRIGELDQKLWVALACPTSGLEIDARTLALIDTDKDGRVRANELIAAVRFACDNLKRPEDLLKGEAALPLAAINDAAPEGKTLLSAARRILTNVGKPEATTLSAEDLARGRQQRAPLGRPVVDGGERQRGRAREQVVRVLEVRAGERHGGDELVRAHAPILVGVDERERARVDLEPARRAGQRDPQLLVELAEGAQVGGSLELDLIEAARREEAPDVLGLCHLDAAS